MHCRKSHVGASKLDVQERDFCFTQFFRKLKLFLDAGLRMDGILAFDLWDLVIEVFHYSQ